MTSESMSAVGAISAGPSTGTMNVMRAIRIHRRGGPEALFYEDAPIPALQPVLSRNSVDTNDQNQ